jgi:hypothetical protein
MLVSQSLLYHHSFTLDSYALPRHEPEWRGDYFTNGPDYQLELSNGHLYYHFPPGSPVLSIPYVALMNAIGISAANADGTYNPRGEVAIEASLAALLMATLAVVFLLTARLLLPLRWGILVALGGTLGTQVYSTASRALWSDTWGSLIIGLVVLMLLAHESERYRLRPVLLGSLLSLAYFVRPTFAIPIVAITIYLLVFYRRLFPAYAITGGVFFALFVLYSWLHFGTILPSYYLGSRLKTNTFWTALAGNLVSPGRGTFVYIPTLFFVGYLIVRYWRNVRYKRLVSLTIAIVIAHLFVISSFPHWWGGHSFGPRFTTGLVPWFVLLAIVGIDAMIQARHTRQRVGIFQQRTENVLGASLLLTSLFIHTVGATQHATWLWNIKPLQIDEHPERLWDWRQPQFLAKYLPYPPPQQIPAITSERIDFSRPDSDAYLWFGWTRVADGVWADNDAALVFSLHPDRRLILINASAFVVSGKLELQRVNVLLNERPLTSFSMTDAGPHEYRVLLGSDLLRPTNTLRFQMPDATSSQKLGIGNDPSWRSFKLHSIEIVAAGNR